MSRAVSVAIALSEYYRLVVCTDKFLTFFLYSYSDLPDKGKRYVSSLHGALVCAVKLKMSYSTARSELRDMRHE